MNLIKFEEIKLKWILLCYVVWFFVFFSLSRLMNLIFFDGYECVKSFIMYMYVFLGFIFLIFTSGFF